MVSHQELATKMVEEKVTLRTSQIISTIYRPCSRTLTIHQYTVSRRIVPRTFIFLFSLAAVDLRLLWSDPGELNAYRIDECAVVCYCRSRANFLLFNDPDLILFIVTNKCWVGKSDTVHDTRCHWSQCFCYFGLLWCYTVSHLTLCKIAWKALCQSLLPQF